MTYFNYRQDKNRIVLTVNHEEELEPVVRTSGVPNYSQSPIKSNNNFGNSPDATQQATSNGSPDKVGNINAM